MERVHIFYGDKLQFVDLYIYIYTSVCVYMLIAVVIIFQSITDLIIKLTKRYYLSIRDIDLVKKIKKKT